MKCQPVVPHRNVPATGTPSCTRHFPETGHDSNTAAVTADNPAARMSVPAPSMVRSHAFAWRGRVYAFGGAWFAFRHPDRNAIRNSLRGAHATHWARLPGDDATHVGAFRLPDERGRIHCAVEAARTFLGGDFVGAFEIGSASLPKGWWIVAVADDAVLLDRVYTDLRTAQNTYRSLFVPGRKFDTQIAPREIASSDAREVPLDEFLELSDLPLRRIGARGSTLLRVATAATLVLLGTVLAASHLKDSAESETGTGPETLQPTYPQFADPAAFGLACERAIADALAAELDGWKLASASCTDGEAQLSFLGGQSGMLRHQYRNVTVWEAERRASVSVALETPRRNLLPQQLDTATTEDLADRLSVLGIEPRMELVHVGTESAPFDSYRFQVSSTETMPILIGALSNIQNAEWTMVRFAPDQLQWLILGMIHVGQK